MKTHIPFLTAFHSWGYRFIILLGLGLLWACNDDNDSPLNEEKDLSEVITETSALSSFASATASSENINNLLNGQQLYTIFAPDNAAFEAFLNGRSLSDIPESELTALLRNHIVEGSLQAENLQSGTLMTIGGATVTILRRGDNLFINNAQVTTNDIVASNGIIHILNQVLETEETEEMTTIAGEVVARENLSTLEAILTSGDYNDLLNAASDGSADLTLFAPDNEAFANLLSLLSLELGDIPVSVVEDILQYHIVAESKTASELSDGAMLNTLGGEDITVMIDGSMVTLNPGELEAMVEEADIMATNGVIHQIGGVLIPPSVAAVLGTVVEPAYFRKDFSTLVAAVVKANLLEALLEADGITVFAPTNQAFENAGIDVDALDAETLARVLQYHVLPANVAAGDLIDMLGAAYEAPAGQISVNSLLGSNYPLYFTLNSGMVYINGNTRLDPANIMTGNGTVHVLPEGVLLPPTMTIAEIVQKYADGEMEGSDEDGEFNVLLAALVRASTEEGGFDFLSVVSNPEAKITVFAPTDEAFLNLLNITNISELGDIPLPILVDVLKYHVIVVPFFSVDLLNNNSPATLYSSLSIEVSENFTIRDREDDNEDATIIASDILATNGVIHAINQVLLPFDLLEED